MAQATRYPTSYNPLSGTWNNQTNAGADDGNVVSDIRIKESIPTIKYILEHNAKQIILMSHLGRPDGKVVDKLKMDKVADKLEKALDMTVVKLDDCIDIKIPDAKIIMLENLRFHKEEEKNDEHFAERLSKLADICIYSRNNKIHARMHRISSRKGIKVPNIKGD